FALGVTMMQSLWRGRILLPHPLTRWMLIFFAAQGLSLAFALGFLGTVPDLKVGLLYWLRTLEYFSAALLCLLAVRTWKQLRTVLLAFAVTVALVGIYGVLQELSMVPAFNAMHDTGELVVISYFDGFARERLISTFAGAYDLGAFYVIAVPVLATLWVLSKSSLAKGALGGTIGLSLFCLYLTFARAPLFGVAVALLITLWLLRRRRI